MKDLKFIHITKAAGTSIENAGCEHGLLWGRHDPEYGWWHEIFTRKSSELRNKYDWFMVIRNPYTRILSEWNYICKATPEGKLGFKQGTRQILEKIKGGETWNKNLGKNKGDHYTPQHLYLDTSVTIHILRFESLESDFKEVMQLYKLPIRKLPKDNISVKFVTIKDIDQEILDLINSVYEKDFAVFGYTKHETVDKLNQALCPPCPKNETT